MGYCFRVRSSMRLLQYSSDCFPLLLDIMIELGDHQNLVEMQRVIRRFKKMILIVSENFQPRLGLRRKRKSVCLMMKERELFVSTFSKTKKRSRALLLFNTTCAVRKTR